MYDLLILLRSSASKQKADAIALLLCLTAMAYSMRLHRVIGSVFGDALNRFPSIGEDMHHLRLGRIEVGGPYLDPNLRRESVEKQYCVLRILSLVMSDDWLRFAKEQALCFPSVGERHDSLSCVRSCDQ